MILPAYSTISEDSSFFHFAAHERKDFNAAPLPSTKLNETLLAGVQDCCDREQLTLSGISAVYFLGRLLSTRQTKCKGAPSTPHVQFLISESLL